MEFQPVHHSDDRFPDTEVVDGDAAGTDLDEVRVAVNEIVVVAVVVKELAVGDCHVTHAAEKEFVAVNLDAAEVAESGPETWPDAAVAGLVAAWPGIAAAGLDAAGPAVQPHSAGPGTALAAEMDLVTGLVVPQLAVAAAAVPVLWLSMLLEPEIGKIQSTLNISNTDISNYPFI